MNWKWPIVTTFPCFILSTNICFAIEPSLLFITRMILNESKYASVPLINYACVYYYDAYDKFIIMIRTLGLLLVKHSLLIYITAFFGKWFLFSEYHKKKKEWNNLKYILNTILWFIIYVAYGGPELYYIIIYSYIFFRNWKEIIPTIQLLNHHEPLTNKTQEIDGWATVTFKTTINRNWILIKIHYTWLLLMQQWFYQCVRIYGFLF